MYPQKLQKHQQDYTHNNTTNKSTQTSQISAKAAKFWKWAYPRVVKIPLKICESESWSRSAPKLVCCFWDIPPLKKSGKNSEITYQVISEICW